METFTIPSYIILLRAVFRTLSIMLDGAVYKNIKGFLLLLQKAPY